MKAILLSNQNGTINRVYSESTIDILSEKTELDKTPYKGDDIKENPEKFKDVKYIFSSWGMPPFSEEEIEKYLPNLKCIFYGAGTVQYFARPFLKKGVRVFSAWAANAVPVAEYTLAQIILANKGYFVSSRFQSKGELTKAAEAMKNFCGNFETNVGIIGAGMIGKLVINMLKMLKVNVFVFDPFLPDEKAIELGVKKCDLDTLFEKCFVISNHLANNPQTKGMIGKKQFDKIMPYATFINTGRGAQVKEDDLISLLESRPDVTAILDVTEPEPPVENSPFYSLENCILTPHIAGSWGNETHRMAEYAAEEFLRYISGEKCLYEVTEKMLETMA